MGLRELPFKTFLMKTNCSVTFLAASAIGWLTACDGPSSQAPPTKNTAPVVASPPPPDTTRPAKAAGRPVPFVSPTKVGRLLGPQTPSPPGSRTR